MGRSLVPHPHKLQADPQQAPRALSGISPVGSHATALTFFMSEQPKVRANSRFHRCCPPVEARK